MLVGVLGVFVAAPTPDATQADARAQRPPCGSYRNTVIANDHAKVFRIGFRRETVRRPVGFYVCDVRSRRLRYLGQDDVDARAVRLIRLAGRYVAWEYHLCTQYQACFHAIGRLNVRSGHRRWFDEPPVGRSEADPALDLEVTPRGNVVWIRNVASSAVPRFDVVRWNGTEVTVLDTGPLDQIEPTSLAISGGRAFWFAGGQARSAPVS